MTLDEAIQHSKEVAKKERDKFLKVGDEYICSECGKEHEQLAQWLEELKEYEDLEEQGLLLKLPCKLGTIVFQIENIIECKFNYSEGCPLEWLHCGSEEDEFMSCDYQYRKLIPVTRRFSLDMLDKFGKTVFLTKEDAEKKLNNMKDKE